DLDAAEAYALRMWSIQRNIRFGTVAWCQRLTFSLPSIPSEEEYDILKVKHEQRIKRRIQREKAILMREQQTEQQFSIRKFREEKIPVTKFTMPTDISIAHEQGFSCSSVDFRVDQCEDPFQQQISLLKHYIAEAR